MNPGPAGPRFGLFGGTFNPIHLGHLRAAEEVREGLGLERVIFIPSATPPHKRSDPADPIAPAVQRLDWVERSIADHKGFSVDRVEIDRAGKSYLVDTLTSIRARGSGRRPPVFIVGSDAFAQMGDWKEPERLFTLSDYAVMTRPPGLLVHLADAMPAVVRDAFDFSEDGRIALHREAGTRVELVTITALDISSSMIREARRSGRSIRYLVPESIRESIETCDCYAGPAALGGGHE